MQKYGILGIAIFVVGAVVLVCVTARAGTLQPHEDEKTRDWGYVDTETGQTVLEHTYALALEFNSHGRAFVVDEDGWVCIDEKGRVLLRPFIFDNFPDEFSQGLARFVRDGKMGYFNEKCEVVIPADYDFTMPFEHGRAEVCRGCKKEYCGEHYTVEGGKWGCVDTTGKVIVPLQTGREGCNPKTTKE